MDKFLILKLYRAIGVSHLKTESYNAAIGIFSHYIGLLLDMKSKEPSRASEIDKELETTRKVMCSIFEKKDNVTQKTTDDSFDNLASFFGKTLEDSRFQNFQNELNLFSNKEQDNNISMFSNYAKNLKTALEIFENNEFDESILTTCVQYLYFLNQIDLALEYITYLQKNFAENGYLYFLKGHSLWVIKEYDKAINEFNKLLKLEKNNGFLYYYIGKIYLHCYYSSVQKKYLNNAIKYFNKACELTFNFDFLFERTSAYLEAGNQKEAKKICQFVLKHNPNNEVLSRFLILFIQCGDTESYKKYINMRFTPQYFDKYCQKITKKPMWDCKKNISKKTLLVITEQGFGDIFMFSRGLHYLKNKAKKIIFLARPSTVRLYKYNFPDIEVLSSDTYSVDNIDFDYHIPIMSLINFCDLTKPAEGYLDVDPQDVKRFRLRYTNQLKFNIGIMHTSYVGEYFGRRNIPVEDLAILSNIKDAQLYSFSVDKTLFSQQYKYGIESLGKYFIDFYDTAVAIKAMHMMVSTDNVVLNLAGALGVKTFGLFNTFNVGRWWKKEGPDVGWYKSVKPFTSKSPNEWDKLLARVKYNIEDYRISLREKYLLSVIKQINSDKKLSISDKQNIKAKTYTMLWKETFNKKYLDKYIDIQKEKLASNPDNIIALGNIASFYYFLLDKKEEADKIWAKIIDKTDYPEFLFNYGCIQCSKKNLDDFFKYYPNRFIRTEQPTPYPKFSQPEWKGEKDTKDKTLLVHFEQGFGDSILFSRYLNDVKKLFKEVTFIVQPQLIELMKNSFPDINVDTNRDKPTDYQIPLMSLPGVLKSYPDKYKNNKKWLEPNADKVEEFKKYFSEDTFNIGIFWDSTKTFTKRCTHLKTLLPLGHINKVQLYSLDRNKADAELNYLDDSVHIENLGKHFKDFSDTAAAIENCDLVVSTDSAILNLAGALGKKTFGLFNKSAEWRWYQLEGEDVGWFQSVKPFHASVEDDFSEEINKMTKEINSLIKQNDRF